MNQHSIQKLRTRLSSEGYIIGLEESHISWVLLTPKFAYKILKPVQLPYLDFSTLEKRLFNCNQEIILNRRITKGVYLGIVSIRKHGDQILIGGKKGDIIDYAVKMKHLADERLMRKMLTDQKVTPTHVQAIADQLVNFHRTAEIVSTPPDISSIKKDFADLLSVKSIIAEQLGIDAAGQLEEWVFDAGRFLKNHAARIQERYQEHFYLSYHGDLHSGNIFLLEEPVIFDCIAFNNECRQGDVLNELAFFCMDMDAYGRADLGKFFLQRYLQQSSCMETTEDQLLFQFYKLYRANIRLKVNALKMEQSNMAREQEKRSKAISTYYDLMQKYSHLLFQIDESETSYSIV